MGPKKPVGAICKIHGLSHHFYADDSQLYMTFKQKDLNSRQKASQSIESCLIDIVQWMNTNLLKLNAEKTEVILFMPKRNNNANDDICITVGESAVTLQRMTSAYASVWSYASIRRYTLGVR